MSTIKDRHCVSSGMFKQILKRRKC